MSLFGSFRLKFRNSAPCLPAVAAKANERSCSPPFSLRARRFIFTAIESGVSLLRMMCALMSRSSTSFVIIFCVLHVCSFCCLNESAPLRMMSEFICKSIGLLSFFSFCCSESAINWKLNCPFLTSLYTFAFIPKS